MCFIHRPEYYTKSGEDAQGNDIRGLAEFIVAKHRSGSVDDVKMRFRARFARFENWEDGSTDDPLAAPAMSTVGSRLNNMGPGYPPIESAPLSGGSADFTSGPDDSMVPF